MAIECMVDIEALGDDLLVQVGMVAFDTADFLPLQGATIDIDPLTCSGLPSTETVLWWLRQSPEAVAGVFRAEGRVPLREGLLLANAYYRGSGCAAMWSHATYDAVMLSRRFAEAGLAPAWGRRGVRDLRTLFSLVPEGVVRDAYRTAGAGLTDHVAQDDCVKQIRVLGAAMRALGR
jgi:hypothetical protein